MILIVLASLLQSASSVEDAHAEAFRSWAGCVQGRAKQWSTLPDDADVIALGALGACVRFEGTYRERVRDVFNKAIGGNPLARDAQTDKAVADGKATIREEAIAVVLDARMAKLSSAAPPASH
jgi:hypothetical protein